MMKHHSSLICPLLLFFSLLAAPVPAFPEENEKGGALSIPFDEKSEAGASFAGGYHEIYPYGFKISLDGSLFLSNTLKNSILQFDFMGRLVKSYSGSEEFFRSPGDLTFDSDGMLYFANIEKMTVVKVDMISALNKTFGGYGTGDGNLLSIYQIETAPGKKLFVQDAVSAKINVYSPSGSFIKKIACNVPGFSINLRGQLLFLRRDRLMGYSLYLLEPNSKIPLKLYDIGLAEIIGLEFIGADYKGNIYVATSPDGDCRYVHVYNPNGVLWASHRLKCSPIPRQFFVFGDGSIYSAEVDRQVTGSKPSKISVRKY